MCSACSRLYLECVYPVPGHERKNKKWKLNKRSKSDTTGPQKIHDSCSSSEEEIQYVGEDDNNLQQQQLTLLERLPHSVMESRDLVADIDNSDVLYFMDKTFDLTPNTTEFSLYTSFDVDQFLASKPASPGPILSPANPDGPTSASASNIAGSTNLNGSITTLGHLHDQLPSISGLIPSGPIAPRLDDDGRQMYDYFVNKLAGIICVSPENSFLSVFVPMAWESEAVLFGLVAWASFHKDHGKQQDVGYKYLNRSMQSVLAKFNSGDLSTLSAILLICASEICNGDVVHWSKHLSLAAKIINMNGGLSAFTTSKALQWLASNFAYHDLLAASTTASRNTHFPPTDYEQVMRNSMGPDTLLGCCQPLFQILAEISDLAVEAQKLYTAKNLMPTNDQLRDIRNRAAAIDHKISLCVPDRIGLMSLSSLDLERQMTLFESFQLTARIHLLQSVLRLNASSIEMRCLGQELLASLDVVLGTPVEGGLAFPMFIAGIACPKGPERLHILERFQGFYDRNMARNIKRTKELLQEVWDRDEGGTKHIHWYSIIESRGWDLCFA